MHEYLQARGFEPNEWESFDLRTVRAHWTDEGDGEGYWNIIGFTGEPGRSLVDWEITFSLGTPEELVKATIEAALALPV